MNTEAFIQEILKRPPIWMSKHPKHKLKNVIRRMWQEIKQCFPDYEVEHLRKKWKNLKDTYRKELKKNPYSRSQDLETNNDTASQWRYFHLLTFLNDELMPAESESYFIKTENEEMLLTQPEGLTTPSPLESGPPQEVAPEPSTSQATTALSRKRTKAHEIRTEYLEIERKKLKILEDEIARQNTPEIEKTDDYYYLMSILPELQKLNSIQKMRVRNKINQVLMDEMIININGENTYTQCGYNTQQPSGTNDNNNSCSENLSGMNIMKVEYFE